MTISSSNSSTPRPAGYTLLVDQYGLDVIPNWHRSFVATHGIHRTRSNEGIIEETFPAKYWPGDGVGDHLEFALKYDGVNLAILASLFHKIETNDFLNYLYSKPTGKYARRLWFLYEFLTDSLLPIEDVKQGNYIDLLDSEKYYTISSTHQVRRQRINNNLLGNRNFCPIVRRTKITQQFETSDLPKRCQKIVSKYSPELLKRAMNYLYTKETKSSFEIEHIKPNSTRTERFVILLHLAESQDFCSKSNLIELQNRIVDPRFRDIDYRTTQNYVGETIAWRQERIHFVCPKPENLLSFMEGLIDTHKRMSEGNASVVIHAAAIAYGFVFLHPFEDGNGRIHRFLIHNILARRGFSPQGIMFPVSAAMLKNLIEYDASLESFSQPLMNLVDYSLDENGQMIVNNETGHWYRYIDMTSQTEALFKFIETTIDSELAEELNFLANYDKTKKAIQEIVDMPDRKIDLFIQACLQNAGHLSARKRTSHFEFLSDKEITDMELIIQSHYKNE